MTAIKTVLILLLIASKLLAGTVDLEISLESDINGEVGSGQIGKFSLTVFNHGPDDAGAANPDSFPISVISSDIFLLETGYLEIGFNKDPEFNQDCVIITSVAEPIPGSTMITYAYVISFPVIPVNSSKTCHAIYHVNLPKGKKTITWHAYSFTDNMITNGDETVDMVFGIKPQVIPFFTSIGLYLLILLFISITFFKIYRRKIE